MEQRTFFVSLTVSHAGCSGFLAFPNRSRLHHSESSRRCTRHLKALSLKTKKEEPRLGKQGHKTVTEQKTHRNTVSSQQRVENASIWREKGQRGLGTRLTGQVLVSQIFELHTEELRLASTRDIPSSLPRACIWFLHIIARMLRSTLESPHSSRHIQDSRVPPKISRVRMKWLPQCLQEPSHPGFSSPPPPSHS